MTLTDIETPAALIDETRMTNNIARLQQRMTDLGVRLRPHVKTSKCIEVARRQQAAGAQGITVSTLKEAEQFFAAGFGDILYAVCISPDKLDRALALCRRGCALTLLVDSFEPDIQDDRIHSLLGELQPEYEAQLNGLRAHVSRVDGLDWQASEEQLRASSFEGIPLEVLVAARYEPRLDAATNEVIADAWRAGMEALSPGRTTYTIVYNAGHNIHIERPDTVIDAVRRLVDAARGD